MKADARKAGPMLDRPAPDLRLYLLHGPDEAGAMALAARLGRALGEDAERIDVDAATLKADPARLADEAGALSLFGGARWVRGTGIGDESLAAATALLEADRTGNPVVLVAPAVRTTAAIVKLAIASPAALAVACYVPEGRDAESLVIELAREEGMRVSGDVARRLAQASGGDRAVMAREVEKLALYLDAAPDRPKTLDEEALAAVGADLGEADAGEAIAALVSGRAADLGSELERLRASGVAPVAWLRQLARRLSALAEMRAAIDAGEAVDVVMKRHRVFFREEAATRRALQRWTAPMLATAHDRARAAERAVMAPANAGPVLADQAMLTLGRRVAD